jgi:hypothetical protein
MDGARSEAVPGKKKVRVDVWHIYLTLKNVLSEQYEKDFRVGTQLGLEPPGLAEHRCLRCGWVNLPYGEIIPDRGSRGFKAPKNPSEKQS